jgi:hypothetical protein
MERYPAQCVCQKQENLLLITKLFPDHLVHHLLAMWSLGATPNEIQDMWDYNATYQDSMNEGRFAAQSSAFQSLKDPETFQKCLGIDDCYPDFLQFFENEIDAKGMEAVIKEYLLQGDDRANDILGRMFAGLFFPQRVLPNIY